MDFPRSFSVVEIADWLSCPAYGNTEQQLSGMNEIHRINPGEIVFVDHPKYYEKALNSAASCVLINKKVADIPHGKAIIVSEDPFRDFNQLSKRFTPFAPAEKSISKRATIGEGTVIQPNCFIGDEVTLGKECLIHSGVQLYGKVIVEDRVEIHANTVIGGHAFYYKKRPTGYDKLISCGSVHICSDVEIGANCTIDRGVSDVTYIGKGTKIDNLVQVGHDTRIGEHCLIASHCGIAGCVTIEDHVTLWGQVGVASDITIQEGAVVLAQSGVGNDLEGGKRYFGSPAKEAKLAWREIAALRNLPEALKKLS